MTCIAIIESLHNTASWQPVQFTMQELCRRHLNYHLFTISMNKERTLYNSSAIRHNRRQCRFLVKHYGPGWPQWCPDSWLWRCHGTSLLSPQRFNKNLPINCQWEIKYTLKCQLSWLHFMASSFTYSIYLLLLVFINTPYEHRLYKKCFLFVKYSQS